MTKTAKKIRKISGLILTTTALLIVVAAIVAWILLPRFANKKLTKFVAEKSGGNYHLSIQNIERKYWPFSVKFHEVSFVPDEEFSAKAEQDSTGKTTYSVQAKGIEFEGIKFRKLLRNKALRLFRNRLHFQPHRLFARLDQPATYRQIFLCHQFRSSLFGLPDAAG